MRLLFKIMLICASTQTIHAQTNCGINYIYDNAGTRIERISVGTCGTGGGLPGGHKKEQALTDSSSTHPDSYRDRKGRPCGD